MTAAPDDPATVWPDVAAQRRIRAADGVAIGALTQAAADRDADLCAAVADFITRPRSVEDLMAHSAAALDRWTDALRLVQRIAANEPVGARKVALHSIQLAMAMPVESARASIFEARRQLGQPLPAGPQSRWRMTA